MVSLIWEWHSEASLCECKILPLIQGRTSFLGFFQAIPQLPGATYSVLRHLNPAPYVFTVLCSVAIIKHTWKVSCICANSMSIGKYCVWENEHPTWIEKQICSIHLHGHGYVMWLRQWNLGTPHWIDDILLLPISSQCNSLLYAMFILHTSISVSRSKAL